MADSDAVLFANEAFYLAFAQGDLQAMTYVWADVEAISCIHPGWDALHGHDAVLESWGRILGGDGPTIRCLGARAYVSGGSAYVICYEEIDGNYLIATNLFVRDGSRWRMVHHQAGPTQGRPPVEDEAADLGANRPN